MMEKRQIKQLSKRTIAVILWVIMLAGIICISPLPAGAVNL